MIDIKQHSLYKPMEADSVISNVFNIYFKSFWILFISSFLAAFCIQMTYFQLGFFELTKITDPNELIETIFRMRKEILVISIIYFIIYGLIISFLINYLLKVELNPELKFKEIVIDTLKNHSVHVIFFFILSMIIIIVGSGIGILFLIVGVFIALFYLGTILIPGATIIIAEDKNALETIRRTFHLVHKDFWSSLGAFILFVLLLILISIVLSLITAIPFIISFFENWKEADNFRDMFNLPAYDIGVWSVVINSIVSAITYPLYAILSVVLYFKLRFTEEKHNNN